jgi:hypothetical protein
LYYANVPVQAGGNLITVTATAPDVDAVTRTVIVTGDSGPFEVIAFPQAGIAPHPVAFSVLGRAGAGIARIEIDFGTGAPRFSTTDPDAAMETTYARPGVYTPTIAITDADGIVHDYTRVIVVANVGAIDAKLRAIYADMLGRLRAGDLEGALRLFTASSAETYRPALQLLLPGIASIADRLDAIVDGTIMEGLAEYVLVQDRPDGRRAFLLYLTQGGDGTWRISSL